MPLLREGEDRALASLAAHARASSGAEGSPTAGAAPGSLRVDFGWELRPRPAPAEEEGEPDSLPNPEFHIVFYDVQVRRGVGPSRVTLTLTLKTHLQ